MKRVININFQGRVVPIEETAYEHLKKYLDSLSDYFSKEEGCDEIISDIEDRISELFGEALQKEGSACITEDNVNRIIESIGRPEDLEQEDGSETMDHKQTRESFSEATSGSRKLYRDETSRIIGGVCSGIGNYLSIDPVIIRILCLIFFAVTFLPYCIIWAIVPSSASVQIGSKRRRLFRNPDERIIAGVCSGLSSYFGLPLWIPRLLFIIPFFSFVMNFPHWSLFPHFMTFSFSPGSIFFYILLWIVVPEAKTAAEKLEMKGEKVDLSHIKDSFSIRNEKAKNDNEPSDASSHNASRGLGHFIGTMIRIFVYFIIGLAIFILVMLLLGSAIFSTGIFPMKNFILSSGWESFFAWASLLLFVWVPVLALVTFLVRRLTRIKGHSKYLSLSFLALWVSGILFLGVLLFLLNDDFHYQNHPSEQIIDLPNPSINSLEIKASPYARIENTFTYSFWGKHRDDSVFLSNIKIRIVRSDNDSFHVRILRLANGSSRKEADNFAASIHFNLQQYDSVLQIDKAIALSISDDKFRNQQLIFTIAVPVGKKIKIDKDFSDKDAFIFGNAAYYFRNFYDENDMAWLGNTTYLMTSTGLQELNSDESDDHDDDFDDTTSEHSIAPVHFKDVKKFRDLQRKRSEKLKELNDLNQKLKSDTESNYYHYQSFNSIQKKNRKVPEPRRSAQNTCIETQDCFDMRFSI